MNVSNDASIDALDFQAIKVKLVHKRSGQGWTVERANAVEREYRRFLYLMKKYPNEVTAPSIDVDRFWHQHILDTVGYARDCQAVFGYFLHHNPYLGLGLDGDDSAAWRSAGERMRELYEDAFGEQYVPTASSAEGMEEQAVGTEKIETQAFCTRGTAQAFCTRGTDAQAFCTRTAEVQSFCTRGAETQPFRSVSAGTQAFCTRSTAAQAFCTRTIETQAFCTRTIETQAFCTRGPVTETGSVSATTACDPGDGACAAGSELVECRHRAAQRCQPQR